MPGDPNQSTTDLIDPALKGEKRARQILRALLLIAFAALAGLAIFVYLKQPRMASSAWARPADLVYLSLWTAIAAIGVLATLRSRWSGVAFAAILLLTAEGVAQLYVYHRDHSRYQPNVMSNWSAFEPHPLLVATPRVGTFYGIVHTAQHRRRTINEAKVANPKYIYVFGGSTVYDIAINDDGKTWPSDLSRFLGKDFAVENLGVPGYSSVENLVQTLFAFRDNPPACALYFLDANDLRSAHIRGLRPDYSDFHLPAQVGALQLDPPNFFLNNVLFAKLILSLVWKDDSVRPEGAPSDEMDQRLSDIYTQNMELIGEIGRHFGVKILVVSQVANFSVMTSDKIRGHMPFVRDKDVKPFMQALDRDLQEAAAKSGEIYLGAPQAVDWTSADFFDEIHFNEHGAEKLAELLAKDVADACR
jgi:hypothetical protein